MIAPFFAIPFFDRTSRAAMTKPSSLVLAVLVISVALSDARLTFDIPRSSNLDDTVIVLPGDRPGSPPAAALVGFDFEALPAPGQMAVSSRGTSESGSHATPSVPLTTPNRFPIQSPHGCRHHLSGPTTAGLSVFRYGDGIVVVGDGSLREISGRPVYPRIEDGRPRTPRSHLRGSRFGGKGDGKPSSGRSVGGRREKRRVEGGDGGLLKRIRKARNHF